jgi:hypothetical protein
MKKNLIIYALLYLPFLLSADHNYLSYESLDRRVWFDIDIDKNRLTLVSNLYRDRVRFYRIRGTNTYENQYRDMIKVIDRSKIIYRDARNRNFVSLYLADRSKSNQQNRYRDFDDRHERGDRNYYRDDRYRTEVRSSDADRGINLDFDDRQSNNRRNDYDEDWTLEKSKNNNVRRFTNNDFNLLEGTWKSDGRSENLALVSTREGFKIKYSGTSKWYDFSIQKDGLSFRDDKGNTYSFSDFSTGVWTSENGMNTIRIIKISSSVSY